MISQRSQDDVALEQNAAAISSFGLPDYCSAKVVPVSETAPVPGGSGAQVCITCQPGEIARYSCFLEEKLDFNPASGCRKTIVGDRHLIECERSKHFPFMFDLRRHRAEILFQKLPAVLDMVESFLDAKFRAESKTDPAIVKLAGVGMKVARTHGRNILAGKDLDLAAAAYAGEIATALPELSANRAGIELAAKKSFSNLAGVVADGNLIGSALLPALAPLSEAIPSLSHFKFLVSALLDQDGRKVIEAAIAPYSPDIAGKLSALLEN
ncbi:MAG: hypothetical protein RIQ81_754 [Pseudomonadota bacterium]